MKHKDNLYYQYNILKMLVLKELIVKYKSTLLGYLWSIAHPLMLTIVFYIAFKIVVKIPIENYTLFLITGLFAWQWFMNSVSIGLWSFVSNASLIKKTIFPKYLLPLSSVIVDMLHFIVSIPIFILALCFYDFDCLRVSWFYQVPLLLIFQLLLSFSFALIFGSLNVFYRDIDRIISLVLTLMMYLTPIFYKLDMVPVYAKGFFYLNPMVPLIEMWRGAFMEGAIDGSAIIIFTLHLFFWMSTALYTYNRLSMKFSENL